MSKEVEVVPHGNFNNHIANKQQEEDLALRFKAKALELAREGFFGSLKTRKASLQSSYANLVSLLDQPNIPMMIYGESGSGKRRTIEEYLVLHNFYRRLRNESKSKLRVLNARFLRTGWTDLLSPDHNKEGDFIYLENIDELNIELQKELLGYIQSSKIGGISTLTPRLFLGTESALSMLILKKQFLRELFVEITSAAVFLPSLQERPEDLPHIIQNLAFEICSKTQNPPAWFVDFASAQLWGRNLDELKLLLRNMLTKNPNMQMWRPADLPRLYTRERGTSRFTPAELEDTNKIQGRSLRIKKALEKYHGDQTRTAQELGYTRAELLQDMFRLKIR